ncbi:hypothetical protein L7F22_046144 [Adiantum nelumboides]|nr:hypothetical protein [Adiantum nelumboides]
MYIVVLNPSIVDKWRLIGIKEKVDVEPEEAPPTLNKPNLKLRRVNDMTGGLKAPYEVDELSTHEKSHITDEVLAQIPTHIFIAKFRDEEGDTIKTTIMPREVWILHRRPEVADPIKAVHLEQFFILLPWDIDDYMRAHELMSSIQYDGKAMITDNNGVQVQVLITTDIVNETLYFYPGTYDLMAKTKSIDNEKAFLKAKGNKYKYADMIYSASSRTTRSSKKSSSDDERTDTDTDQDSKGSDKEDIQKGAEAKGPSEHEPSDQEDTSTPLDRKNARAAKAAKITKLMTMEEARKIRKKREEKRKLEAEQKAQEEAAQTTQAAQTKEKEIVDLSGTIEHLKRVDREKHIEEQWAAQLAQEMIKEALKRKAEEPILEPREGSPKKPRVENDEELQNIQLDPTPPSPSTTAPPTQPPSSPKPPPSPKSLELPKSPPAPTFSQQQQDTAKTTLVPPSSQPKNKQEKSAKDKEG